MRSVIFCSNMRWRSSQFLAAVDEISSESRDSGLCNGTGAENVIKTNWVPTYDHSEHGGVSICQSLSLSFNTESTSSATLAFKCSTLRSVCSLGVFSGCEFMGNTIGFLHIMTLQFFEWILNSQLFEWNMCMCVCICCLCAPLCVRTELSVVHSRFPEVAKAMWIKHAVPCVASFNSTEFTLKRCVILAHSRASRQNDQLQSILLLACRLQHHWTPFKVLLDF